MNPKQVGEVRLVLTLGAVLNDNFIGIVFGEFEKVLEIVSANKAVIYSGTLS